MSDPALKRSLSINLPTQAVLGLLEKHPEIEMELLNIVSERVASALKKKSEGMTTERISGILRNATAKAEKDYMNGYVLTQEGKDKIQEIIEVKADMSGMNFFRSRSKQFKKEMQTFFDEQRALSLDILQKELDTAFEKITIDLDERVQKTAREEFFSVLKEARTL